MEFDFDVHQRPERKHRASNALARLLTNQRDNFDFHKDLRAYVVVDYHD